VSCTQKIPIPACYLLQHRWIPTVQINCSLMSHIQCLLLRIWPPGMRFGRYLLHQSIAWHVLARARKQLDTKCMHCKLAFGCLCSVLSRCAPASGLSKNVNLKAVPCTLHATVCSCKDSVLPKQSPVLLPFLLQVPWPSRDSRLQVRPRCGLTMLCSLAGAAPARISVCCLAAEQPGVLTHRYMAVL
jgi:hypothetical protein